MRSVVRLLLVLPALVAIGCELAVKTDDLSTGGDAQAPVVDSNVFDSRGVDALDHDSSLVDSTTLDAIDASGDAPCDGARTSCGGSCVDTSSDPNHCGACGNECDFCVGGKCQCTELGGVVCGGTLVGRGHCAIFDSDPLHCSACARTCDRSNVCRSSSCECRPGWNLCGANKLTDCREVQSDPANCGTCNHKCATSEVCSNGACVAKCDSGTTACGSGCFDTQISVTHCGSCDHPCDVDKLCIGGACNSYVASPCTTCPCAACGARKCCDAFTLGGHALCVDGPSCPK